MQIVGISDCVAKARLESEGPNEIPLEKKRYLLLLVKEVLFEPMVSLIVGCGMVYLLLGDKQEALSLLVFLLIIIMIEIYQEIKTENALESLRSLSSPRALVIRDGLSKRIAAREVVLGDFLLLSEGDRVPADARILDASNLLIDESLLTGESIPAQKRRGDTVSAGTTLVRGQCTALVFATGIRTQFGKIGRSLGAVQPGKTQLQMETARFVQVLAKIAILLCFFVVVVYGFTRKDWLGGLLTGLTLAMAILPNELPAVLVIFLALGARRISKRSVLTRKMPAVENLGSATVLCVDKTGTLTLNQMRIQRLYRYSENGSEIDLRSANSLELPEEFHPLIEFGILASSPSPFDPMEKALHQFGKEYLSQTEHIHPKWNLTKEYPLTREMLAVSQVWRNDRNETYIVGAKGAPEAIINLCHLNPIETARVTERVNSFANRGLRVLGVARATLSTPYFPSDQHDYDFEFLGLLGLADPVRPHVPEAISECYEAGVRVIMITGDHAQTARSVAREIGIKNPNEVISGDDFTQMNDTVLSERLKVANCFARMIPEQKLRLVDALKRNGEIVAMTGDGVNDAPALKSSQIGIAMGARGADVAREAAAIVLLNDDFSSIVEAIRTGRRIFDNLRGTMAYLLAIHVAIAGISILPVILHLPLVLLPIHIAFLHLIIEPACSIVFEAEPPDPNIMKRFPRNINKPLFSKGLIIPSVFQGFFVLSVVLAVFLISLYRGQGGEGARALTFTTLVFSNLGLIIVNRSWSKTFLQNFKGTHQTLLWVFLASFTLLGMVLYVPAFRKVFHFSLIHPWDLALCFGAAVVSIFWFDFWKKTRC